MNGVTNVKPIPSTAKTPHTKSCRDGESDAKEFLLMGLPQFSLPKQNRTSGKMQVSLSPINVMLVWKSAHLQVNDHIKIIFRIFRNSVME
jgi:hypothetical protein